MKKIAIILSLLIYTSVSASFYRDTIKYMASKKLEGRRSGTSGNELATDFSIKLFKKFGLSPFAGSYKQEFTIFTEMIKFNKNEVSAVGEEKDIDFQPITYSLSGELTAKEIAFVGYGITIPKSDSKLKYDDYSGINVEDKIVVILTGDPGIGNKNSLFRDPDYINYRSIFYKLKNAISKGAKGAVIIQDPMSLSNYPKEKAPYFNSHEGGGDRFSIIAGYSTNKWINKYLKKAGHSTLELQKQITKSQKPSSIILTERFNLAVNLKKKTGKVSNVIGVLPGNHPTLSKEVIVIGAHFDHLGYGGESSLDPQGNGKIHPGADDNASGTALVLKLAKKLALTKHSRTYIFTLFNAEEVGLLGSTHFVDMWQRHGEQYGKLAAMLNFDMVGRYQGNVSVMGANSGNEWKSLLSPLEVSSFKFSVKDIAIGSSDHASFTNKKIPSLFFTTDAHEDYHKSSDTYEKINTQGLDAIEQYATELIRQLERTPTLSYNNDYSDGSEDGRARGYGAHLGCVPVFGQDSDIEGVLCTRASKDSPAMSAGIVANDILIQIGEIQIKSIYDLAFALKYYRAGDLVELAWLRDGKTFKKKVKLTKSNRGKSNKHDHYQHLIF